MTPTEEINLMLRILKSREEKMIKDLCPKLPEVLYIIEKGVVVKCRVTSAGIMLGRCVSIIDHLVFILTLLTNEITLNDIFYTTEYFIGTQGYISIARHQNSFWHPEDAYNSLIHLNLP